MTAEQIKGEELFPSVRLVIEHILDPTTGTVFATIHYDDEKRVIVKHTLDFCAAN